MIVVGNEDCLENIKKIFEKANYLMDPHSSVAQAVAERYIKQNNISAPVIICSTAHWAKFAKDMSKALIDGDSSMSEFEILEKIKKIASQAHIPEEIKKLGLKDIKHKEKCIADKEIVENIIKMRLE